MPALRKALKVSLHMNTDKSSIGARITIIELMLILITPINTMAYIDPGTTGMISQMLYVLFYGALGLFFYFLRQIKGYLARTKDFLTKLLGRRS